METTYRINVNNMEWLQGKIGKLQRKAEKLGLTPLQLEIVSTETVPVMKQVKGKSIFDKPESVPTGEVKIYNICKLVGSSPVIDGWKLVAVLQSVVGNTNVVRAIDELEIPTMYRETGTICEHCGIKRKRNDTYLIQHLTGEYMQVGKSCLKDFLGHEPEGFLNFAKEIEDIYKYLEEMEKPEFVGGYDKQFISIPEYLEFVAKCIREDGWMSRTKAKKINQDGGMASSTADRAHNDMFPHPRYTPTKPTNEDIELAKNAYEWITQQDTVGANDYLFNCITFAKNGYCEWRDLGYVASIITSYQKAMEMKINRQQRAKMAGESRYVGEIGSRLSMKVTFTRKASFDTTYGMMNVYNFVDETGNAIVWKTSNWYNLEQGDALEIVGSVKEHSEYKGLKQTVLTRCKLN